METPKPPGPAPAGVKVPRARRSINAEVPQHALTADKSDRSKPAPARTTRERPEARRRSLGGERATSVPGSGNSSAVSPEERYRLIAEGAYYRAERRGFEGGEQARIEDWLAAEAEVDSELAQRGYGEAREQPGL